MSSTRSAHINDPARRASQRRQQPDAPERAAGQEADRIRTAQPMAPGDEAPAGSAGTGENVCPACGGSGRAADGRGNCAYCGGTGKVTVGIGGA